MGAMAAVVAEPLKEGPQVGSTGDLVEGNGHAPESGCVAHHGTGASMATGRFSLLIFIAVSF